MRVRSWFACTMLLTATILGCAGGGSSASPGAASQDPTTTEPARSDPASTPAPGASAEPTSAPSQGGGTAVGVCELVTPDELASILGKTVSLTVLTGPPDTCDVQSNGAPIAAFVWMEGPSFGFAFDAWAGDPSAEDVPGIGDRAVYVAASELLIVKRGDRLFSVAVFDVDVADADRVRMMTEIARVAAGRM